MTTSVMAEYTIALALRRGPLDLAPWLYVTPAELAPFRDLLLRLGAREAFSAAQYAAVLSAMAQRAGRQPLDAITLAQAISIVQVSICCMHASGVRLIAGTVVQRPDIGVAAAAPCVQCVLGSVSATPMPDVLFNLCAHRRRPATSRCWQEAFDTSHLRAQ